MAHKISTKFRGWDADDIPETIAILRQIKNSYDFDSSGRGNGIKVTIDGVTHTIKYWLRRFIQNNLWSIN